MIRVQVYAAWKRDVDCLLTGPARLLDVPVQYVFQSLRSMSMIAGIPGTTPPPRASAAPTRGDGWGYVSGTARD